MTYSRSLENSAHIHFFPYICLSWQLHIILCLATVHVIFVRKSLIDCIEKMQWLCAMKLFAQLINKGLYRKSEVTVVVFFFFFFWEVRKNFLKRKYYFIRKRWSSLKNICTRKQQKWNYVQDRESMNKGTESLDVNPWAQDQSYKVPANSAMSWSPDRSKSSKIRFLPPLFSVFLMF